MKTEVNTAHPRILRFKDVMNRVGLGKTAIYDRLTPKSPLYDPSFPKAIKLGSNTVGFLESEVDGWIEARLSERQQRAA